MNARHNGYFNAKVIYNESLLALEDEHQDLYSKTLDMYPELSIDDPSVVKEDLDIAIEKLALVANLHQPSHWVDDCYVLVGKSQFLKQDFEAAEETLQYFSDNFNPSDPGSRVYNNNLEKDKNAARKREQQEQRKQREIDRKLKEEEKKKDKKAKDKEKKQAEKEREAERKQKEQERKRDAKEREAERKNMADLKAKDKDADEKLRSEVQSIKEKQREAARERAAGLRDLMKKQREDAADLKRANSKKLSDLNADLRKARQDFGVAERERLSTERDRAKKEREEAAKERRRKSDTQKDVLSQSEIQLTAKIARLEKEIEAFEKSQVTSEDSTAKGHESAIEQYKKRTEEIDREYITQIENVDKQKESAEKNREERDARIAAEKEAKAKEKEEAAARKEQVEEEAEQKEEVAEPEEEILDETSEDEVAENEEDFEAQDTKAAQKYNTGKSGGFLKHKPAYAEGLFWLARTYIERQNWVSAELTLSKLEEDNTISKDIAKQLPATRAYFYMKQKKINAAKPHLEKAIEVAPNKADKARYAYILGQLHQIDGSTQESAKNFELAKRFARDYEMKFNANLSMIRNDWSAGGLTTKSAGKKLNGLARDRKNEEYIDQIYFTKAEILLADGDVEGALEEFKKASSQPNTNPARKADSYYRLADLFFGRSEFLAAKNYFDSTLQVMSKKDERYNDVKRKSENLRSIATNSEIVNLQDSLLTLANLPEDQLNAWAEKEYEKSVEEEKESGEAEEDQKTVRPPLSTLRKPQGSFFAYNDNQVSKGKSDFNRKWGTLSLQDNWRRSDVVETIIVDEPLEEIAEADIEDENKQEEIELLLREVPRSAKQKDIAKQKMESAMYGLGTELRTKLQNYEKSNEQLLTFIERFPTSPRLEKVYYYLYLNNLDLDNPSGANLYQNLLVTEFPNSDLAKAITDPTYVETLETEEKKLAEFYEETYLVFESGDYAKANEMAAQHVDIFGPKNSYAAKFDLIQAMSKGAKEGKDDYIVALKNFISKYPNTPETTRATEIMRFLRGDDQAFDSRLYTEQIENFKIEEDKLHYVIVVLYDLDAESIRNVKLDVNDYNRNFHKLENLRITNIYLNTEEKVQVLLIRTFENKSEALNYIAGVDEKTDRFLDVNQVEFDIFAASQGNYREIMKQKTMQNYEAFYDLHYVQ